MVFRNKKSLVVALLLLAASNPAALGEGNDPGWVADSDESSVTRELMPEVLVETITTTKKSETPKVSKKSKTSKKSKAPKKSKDSKKSSKSTKEQGELESIVQQAAVVRDELQKIFNFDADAMEACENDTDDHKTCVYSVHPTKPDFDCECKPTSGALIFEEVDDNNDDHITLEEILNYFNKTDCVFPFKYEFEGVLNTYNECTSDDARFEWCSIQTLSDGVHATGFFKYCDDTSNESEWFDALDRLDTNEDGKLSFDEAITNAKQRRQRRLIPSTRYQCDDYQMPPECDNTVVNAIDAECRNYIKTERLNDDELLHMLAYAMEDSYCTDATLEENEPYNCPTLRDGMDEWITRTHLEPYPSDATKVYEFLFCLFLTTAASNSFLLAMTSNALGFVFGDGADFVGVCRNTLLESIDGRNALQWATYRINQGEHQGKKILAYMGSDLGFSGNAEQLMADIWSVPNANYMMKNMAAEATQVALDQEADFITGHSLGGILAEMVCSETGIPGASFAALGAFDPFSKSDQARIDDVLDGDDDEILERIEEDYTEALLELGYDIDDVETMLENENKEELRRALVLNEYDGLISNTQHSGVKFEVVLNTYDLLARPLSSIDGSACSHIARSDDLRWLWFGADKTLGHSVQHYTYNTRTEYTHGWDGYESANIDLNKLFLDGVERNPICDFCEDNRYCDSGSCDTDEIRCLTDDGKKPSLCPDGSTNEGERSTCEIDSECKSENCAWSWLNWDYLCYE